MRGRHLAREIAFKTLFEALFNPQNSKNEILQILQRQLDDKETLEFCQSLVEGCLEKQEELLKTAARHADNWSPERFATTDKVLILLGLFEMIYLNQASAVVIDEAVELAKKYGSCESPSFVNGVLDSFNRTRS
jgi:N utilization substance protein B